MSTNLPLFCTLTHQELDMSEIITGDDTSGVDDAIYDLQSVVVHRGEYGSGESLICYLPHH